MASAKKDAPRARATLPKRRCRFHDGTLRGGRPRNFGLAKEGKRARALARTVGRSLAAHHNAD
eukprot:11167784-Lingulodinium_polyedra.AAC.1